MVARALVQCVFAMQLLRCSNWIVRCNYNVMSHASQKNSQNTTPIAKVFRMVAKVFSVFQCGSSRDFLMIVKSVHLVFLSWFSVL